MASMAISDGISRAQAAGTVEAAQTHSYLQRIVEQMQPDCIAKHDRNAFLWDLASKATLVGFFALALGVFLTVGIFSFAYLPFAGIATFCGMHTANGLREKFSLYASQEEGHAREIRAITEECNALPSDGLQMAQKLANQMKIQLHQISPSHTLGDLSRLKPLVAQYEYLRKRQENHEQEMQAYMTEASSLIEQTSITEEDPVSNARDLRLCALACQTRALFCKIKAAFIHAVIQRPEFSGNFTDLVNVNWDFVDRALARSLPDLTADHFAVFHNRSVQPISYSDLQGLNMVPTDVLAHKFVRAIDMLDASRTTNP